ncbi:DUF7662 domain-containing protein [Sphingopyxis sp. RIFCSPHIGHO2_12_FULL_65_19]|uniref:DUF7662 domain-containing protein n=1 Tax=Sphingopyxis sp. RIFCSPHIGHO2_12_FULL_65_19 TaxID=1802172 RepID=UPI0008C5540B|nr:hypothetical protein [Sphingopyxis sp. RIFCSPHIGHO2_12_FULL_65_19]OHD06270.1 MAG: hypothetical protein A3E77_13180 [Sphingopyxis sp. RIFCSPHIGHO2_12_FULL_65_19]
MLVAKDTTANSRSTVGRWPDEHLTMHLEAFNAETGEFRARGTRKADAVAQRDSRKYKPLFDYLSMQTAASLLLPLSSIEEIVGWLPDGAATSQFWANTQYHLSRRSAWLDAGYHAFYDAGRRSVRFERVATPNNPSSSGWTDDELEACVGAYRQLWTAQQKGTKLNKSALRREILATALSARNHSAYERRMQNISAVLAAMNLEWVKGYAPLDNMGAVRSRVDRMVTQTWREVPRLHIVTRKGDVRSAFRKWQAAILEAAQYDRKIGWLPDEQIAVASYGDAPDGELHEKATLGVDPFGRDWSVQINIPSDPKTENGSSAVARDELGRLYMIRQGTLHENNQSARVDEIDFRDLSGMTPADVRLKGEAAHRLWFIVTPITDYADEMRRNTARFVKICAALRVPEGVDRAQAKADAAEIMDRFGRDEEGGSSTFWSQGGSRTMRKRHGEVWQALKEILKTADKDLRKPIPARGYDTDGEIDGEDGGILVEIKTGFSAVDVYAGTGQLLLYSKMLARLDGHRKILLLPRKPQAVLCEALEQVGIELHFFDVADDNDWSSATFSRSFLDRCGVP